MSCQYLTLLHDVGNMLSTGTQVTQTATSLPAITSLLNSLWQAFENEITVQFSTLLPMNELTNISSAVKEFVKVTSLDLQAILANIFYNSSHVEEELSQFVKLNRTSISALMNVVIPENKTKIGSWFTTLYQCSTNTSMVAEPFQVFCNLSSEQGYQMAIIFLENVDLIKFLYRLAIPSTMQADFDRILAALKTLLEEVETLLTNTPSDQEISQLLSFIKQFTGVSTTRKKRSVDSLNFPGTTRASIPTFTYLSKAVCTGNLTTVIQVLSYIYPSIKSATNRNSGQAKSTTDA
ncbi:glucosylceramide transporter ABCA12-like [Pyxicephalus adspersus]|uniref:glucosylceramide transporter ABCA12-like n=1 Tax=Pyxicephalus adspersus TaxID=30357 RepID=UPI003B5CB842